MISICYRDSLVSPVICYLVPFIRVCWSLCAIFSYVTIMVTVIIVLIILIILMDINNIVVSNDEGLVVFNAC